MNDYLGMESDAPIITPPDMITLGWERYDEIATRLDLLIRERLDIADAVTFAASAERNAHRDVEALRGDCTCQDDDRTTCAKCVAYIRVIGWSKQR